ncbi:MAG: rod shape-determining protein MreC, partial [Alloprevotella sp.]|nr:rod shape-determining protein MreC [Alloprevotella sp.]
MNTLLDFLRKYNYFFVFILLEAVSFVLLFRFNNYQGSIYLTGANAISAKIGGLYNEGVAFVGLRNRNKELTERNIILEHQNNTLRETLARLGHVETTTEHNVREVLRDFNLIPATVVSNSAERINNYLVIDKGENQGVRPEMGVIGGGGVVGIVYLTGKNHSLVIPVTNRKSSISCRIRGGNYFGSLQWDGKSFLRAYLDDIPRYADVKPGATIETSGYSAVFPPGIFVGRVLSVGNSKDGQSYRLEV